jgi:hypothetical protein
VKLTDLEPRFLRCTTPLTYKPTDDIAKADALQLRCPACHWTWGRFKHSRAHVHSIVLWRPAQRLWGFSGRGYADLSLMAGKLPVTILTGCKASFGIRGGKVDFA